MSYTKLLNNLPVSRLREIMKNRGPALRSIPYITDKPSLCAFLSEALQNRDSVDHALHQTNKLQMRVLAYVIYKGGSAPLESLVAEVGTQAQERIIAAVDGLESLGLALWADTQGKRSIYVPALVCQHTPLPVCMRYPIETALSHYDAKMIEHIYNAYALPEPDAANKGTRVQRIVSELTTREALMARLDVLPAATVSYTHLTLPTIYSV